MAEAESRGLTPQTTQMEEESTKAPSRREGEKEPRQTAPADILYNLKSKNKGL